MTVIGFPSNIEQKTLKDWPWEPDQGKPYDDINGTPPEDKNDLAHDKASPAATICREAAALLDGDRAKQHGDKIALHKTMAGLFAAYLDIPISPKQAAMLEVLLKAARTKHGLHNKDDYIDGAAYFGIAAECADAGC